MFTSFRSYRFLTHSFVTAVLLCTVSYVVFQEYVSPRWFPSVVMEPAEVKFANVVKTNTSVRIPFLLKNTGLTPVVVEQAFKTCTCTEITSSDHQIFSKPIEIPAGEALPVEAEINLANRSGEFNTAIGFRFKSGNWSKQINCTISMNIAGTWEAYPAQLSLKELEVGKPSTHIISILDSDFSEADRAAEVVVSDPLLLKAELLTGEQASLHNNISPALLDQTFNHVAQQLKVTLTPKELPSSLGTAWITLTPHDSTRMPLRIPINWSIKMSEKIQLTPAELFFPKNVGGTTVQRQIHCKVPVGKPHNLCLRPQDAPLAEAKIQSLDSGKLQIDLKLAIPESEPQGSITFLFADTKEVAFEIPWKVL